MKISIFRFADPTYGHKYWNDHKILPDLLESVGIAALLSATLPLSFDGKWKALSSK